MNLLASKIYVAVLFAVVVGTFVPAIYAQDTSSSQPSSPQDNSSTQSSPQEDSGAAPAATVPPEVNVENPPLSGLDEPQAEPAYGGRSYLIPALQFSESADSNASGTSARNTSVTEASRGLASLDLQKIWKRSQLALDDIGGDVFYTGPRFSSLGRNYPVNTFAGDERILWRTGQFTIRDSFNYMPYGSFGLNSFGGASSFGSALGGGLAGGGAGTGVGTGLTGGTSTGLFNSGSYGSIGFQPRVSNTGIVDIVQELSPRSSVTLAGSYDYTHFLNKSQSSVSVIDSQLASGQVGYDRILNRKDQIGFLYAFEELHFPISGSGTVDAQVWNAIYGHRITGRLNLVLAGGPQLVTVYNPPNSLSFLAFGPSTRKISGNGKVIFHYIVTSRTNVQIQYQRYVSPGSGFFAGANTDAARVSLGHVFGRRWTGITDSGYSHHSSIQKNLLTGGINSSAYQFWYAGASLRRQLGQHFGAFVSYQFNNFGAGQCASSTGSTAVCGQSISQHNGVIGFDWHPRPIRLD